MHLEAFCLPKFKLFTFDFSLYEAIDFNRVNAAGTDANDVIDERERWNTDASFVLKNPFVLCDTFFPECIDLYGTLNIGQYSSLHL